MNVSMVISTYNRGRLLRTSLQRLTELTLPTELIVVDDGSEDETEAVCREYEDRLPLRYVYTHNPGHSICSHARNVGVKLATSDWIVTSEPELVYRTDVIAQFIERQDRAPSQDVISAGRVFFAGEHWHPEIGPEGMEIAGDYKPPDGVAEAIGWVAPYTALWKRSWLVDVGGWDECFPGDWGWDDIDLLTRLRINGHGQFIDLGIEAIHQWHGGSRGDPSQINEAHFRAKSFTTNDESDHRDLVANKEIEWGTPRPR